MRESVRVQAGQTEAAASAELGLRGYSILDGLNLQPLRTGGSILAPQALGFPAGPALMPLGILLLALIIALIIEWLLGPILVPALASADETDEEDTSVAETKTSDQAVASATSPGNTNSETSETPAAV